MTETVNAHRKTVPGRMTNKRYADAIDKRMAAHTDEIIMRDRQPSSLNKEELELDRLPLTRTPVAIPAWAWIHY